MPIFAPIDVQPYGTKGTPFSHARSDTCWSSDFTEDRVKRDQLDAMLAAFMLHGGMLTTDEVTERLRASCDQPISKLARWIVSGSTLSLTWHRQTLMPAFQFHFAELTIRPRFSEVLRELRSALDDWEIALWFATPNATLGNAMPVNVLANDAPAVVQAARVGWFIVRG